MKALRVCVVGAGAMGRLHARTVSRIASRDGGCTLSAIVDHHPGRAEAVVREFGGEAHTDFAGLVERVDAVVLAVPTAAHFEIGSWLLASGLDLLVEKPFAASVAEAESLVVQARRHERILQVGHIEWYNPSWRAAAGLVGPIRKIDVERVNSVGDRGLDIDVVQDLMLHDLDWVSRLVGEEIDEIRASGYSLEGDRLDEVEARLCFSSGCSARLVASRIRDERRRVARIEGRDAVVTADLLAGKAFRGEGGAAISGTGASLDRVDPLEAQWNDFVSAVRSRKQPANGGAVGLAALRLVERVREAVEQGGTGADHDHDSRLRR